MRQEDGASGTRALESVRQPSYPFPVWAFTNSDQRLLNDHPRDENVF